MALDFHDIRFPPRISRGCRGGPQRKTIVVALGNGKEQRNQQWADSRRRYNAGYGVRNIDDIHAIIDFFEERRGRLTAFRWKDWSDFKSCPPGTAVTAIDQQVGTGTGAQAVFQLVKTYGGAHNLYERIITKPVSGTVKVALNGVELANDFAVDHATGLVTLAVAPGAGVVVTAGFEFDVPARFDTDILEVEVDAAPLGNIPDIPVVEVLQ